MCEHFGHVFMEKIIGERLVNRVGLAPKVWVTEIWVNFGFGTDAINAHK